MDFVLFAESKCRKPGVRRISFPVPEILKRLATDFLVFCMERVEENRGREPSWQGEISRETHSTKKAVEWAGRGGKRLLEDHFGEVVGEFLEFAGPFEVTKDGNREAIHRGSQQVGGATGGTATVFGPKTARLIILNVPT